MPCCCRKTNRRILEEPKQGRRGQPMKCLTKLTWKNSGGTRRRRTRQPISPVDLPETVTLKSRDQRCAHCQKGPWGSPKAGQARRLAGDSPETNPVTTGPRASWANPVARRLRNRLQRRSRRRCGSDPGVAKIPWRRARQPLHHSCPANPIVRGAWQALGYSVARSRIRLKRLSMAQHSEPCAGAVRLASLTPLLSA